MIFLLDLSIDKKTLTHIPHIDSIYINLDGKSVCCTWDETDAGIAFKTNGDDNRFKGVITYRFKGVYFDNEYANGTLTKESSIKLEEINWGEDDHPEEFEYDIYNFTILDNDTWLTPRLKKCQ